MATIRLTISVDDIAATLAVFDKIKVYRSTTGSGGPFTELTTAGTRPTLVAGQSVYFFDDAAGDPTYWYKTSFFNSTTLGESSLSAAIQGDTDPLYISVQDIRDAGVTVAEASDALVLSLIRTFQQVIDRLTRNFFTPRQMTLDLDGKGTTLLQLPFPIISISKIYLNDEFSLEADLTSFSIYSGRGETERDDRRNPRIKIRVDETSIFTGTGPLHRSRVTFNIGEKNQRVIGTFGYLEPDGCTPEAIKYAHKKLVLQNLKSVTDGGSSSFSGPIVEEETDRHRRKYSDVALASKAFYKTGDPQVDQILSAFRGPWFMGAPRTQFRRLTGGGIGV